MPPTRPRIPEYPRPVPQICTDEIPVGQDTILYEIWTDEADQEAEKRATKRRRRIEDAAHAYLRGEPVLILSASLKGPFDNGWKNPWRKKRRQISTTAGAVDDRTSIEVPETNARRVPKQNINIEFKDVDDNPRTAKRARATREGTPIRDRKRLDSPFHSRDDLGNISTVPLVGSSATSRVEDWLKTNDAYLRRKSPERQNSPTPVKNVNETKSHLRVPEMPLHMEPEQRPTNDEISHTKPKIEHQAKQDVPFTTDAGKVAHTKLSDLYDTRRSIHMVPPSTNQPAFEYRRARNPTRTTKLDDYQVGVGPEKPSKNDENAAEINRLEGTSTLRPELSTETTKNSTLHNLPSAQVPPLVPIEQQASNNVSSAKMLEELPQRAELDVDVDRDEHKVETMIDPLRTEVNGLIEDKESNTVVERNAVDQELVQDEHRKEGKGLTPANPPIRELNTQEIIAGIEPINFSTIKKPTVISGERSSPKTATKVKPDKKRKHASFADKPLSVSSQGSLKASMKVTKSASVTLNGFGSPATRKLQDVDIITNSIDEEPSQVDENWQDPLPLSPVLPIKNSAKVRSILKSSALLSSAATSTPFPHTYSTSTKQDAQRVPGQNINAPGQSFLEDDENFDLNAAIDDLGSFLGTWDPEKEASVLVASSGA